MDRKEVENEAIIRAREQLESFAEIARIVTGNKEHIDQLETTQKVRAWLRQKFGYSEDEGSKALQQEREQKVQELYRQNLAHLTEIDAHAKAVFEKSWQIFTENFVAIRVENGKKLKWNEAPESDSPTTALEIVKEVFCIPDDIVLKDPREFLAHLIRTFDGETVKHRYGTDENRQPKIAMFQIKAQPKA